MKALWVCALACACACAAQASPQPRLPECEPSARAVGACAADVTRLDGDGGQLSNNYVVEGKRVTVESDGVELRWRCARGAEAFALAAPRFSHNYYSKSVEIIDCKSSRENYEDLLRDLRVTTENLTLSSTTNSLDRNIRWPSADELNEIELATVQRAGSRLQHLSLRGISMSIEQLAGIQCIKTLSLERTGLKEVMNMSQFSELTRLEVREPELRDASSLQHVPALAELVLQAPDAGLASMPLLRSATFLDVYAMENIFRNCARLEELTLDGGQLCAVRGRWLEGCSRLRLLRLTHLPRLRELPLGLLAEARGLRRLVLSHNGLQTLPDDLLAGTPSLVMLDLSHNALQTLPDSLLVSASGLTVLNLGFNDLMAVPAQLPATLVRLCVHLTPQLDTYAIPNSFVKDTETEFCFIRDN